MGGNKSLRTPSLLVPLAAVLAGCGGGAGGSSGSAAAEPVMNSAGSTGSAGPGTAYTVSGAVAGLNGTGLVLELNGSQDLPITTDGTFTFPDGLMSGTAYSVTVKTQPGMSKEVCAVNNGSGTIDLSNVDSVAVQCASAVGFLFQAVPGQMGTGYTFLENDEVLSYAIAAGTGTLLPFGSALALPAGSQPSGGSAGIATAAGGGFLYVGGVGTGSNISLFAVDSTTGALSAQGQIPLTGQDAVKLLMSPAGLLFVLGNDLSGQPGANMVLSTYRADPLSGALTSTGSALSFPAFGIYDFRVGIALTPDGRFLYVVFGNYDTNIPPTTVTAYAVDPATGGLTAGPAITPGVNTDTVAIDPLGRFLYLASFQGGPALAASTILPYTIDAASGALTPVGSGTPVPTNSGGLVADPTGRYLYAINNLNSNSANDTVVALGVDQSSGALTMLGTPLLIDGAPTSIVCDPSGQFVFVGSTSLGSSSGLAAFAISSASGTAGQLTPSGQAGPMGTWSGSLAVIE